MLRRRILRMYKSSPKQETINTIRTDVIDTTQTDVYFLGYPVPKIQLKKFKLPSQVIMYNTEARIYKLCDKTFLPYWAVPGNTL